MPRKYRNEQEYVQNIDIAILEDEAHNINVVKEGNIYQRMGHLMT